MARTNMVIDPSLRSGGTTHFLSLNGATLSYSEDYAWYGYGSLKIVKSALNNSGVSTANPMPVVAGLPYAASVYARIPLTLPPEESAYLTLQVQWRNSLNIVIDTDVSGVLSLEDDTDWSRIGGVWVAPPGATVAYITVTQVLAGTAGAEVYLDAFLFEQSNYIGGYFDNITQAEENKIVNKALTRPTPSVINGLELNADVILNDLVLNTIDEFGNIWICTDIDGWWGHSTPESPDIPRGNEDGSYDVSGRYQARVLTLTGVVFPPSPEALGAARDRLVTATDLNRQAGWLRTNEAPTKAASVRLSGRPMIKTVNARGRTEFSIGLKAADPIKYHWNDQDPDGYTQVNLGAAVSLGIAKNIGNADVTGVFTITGPLGAGSTIYNAGSGQTLTLAETLRGAGAMAAITSAGVAYGIATITTAAAHHLLEGDLVNVSGAGAPFDTGTSPVLVLAASDTFPYTFSYEVVSDDLSDTAASGIVQLVENDVLVIDTYNRSVTYNGNTTGQRSKISTLTDWIKLVPGDNPLEFTDTISPVTIINKSTAGGISTLVSDDTHYLIPGEEIDVALNEVATLSKKSLTSNVVTLTTVDPHGFSVSDKIDVLSVEQSTINNKVLTSNVVTITTVNTHGISVSDSITVNMPTSAAPTNKALTSNVATITTQFAHGFSVGDSVVVALSELVNIVFKALTSNQAILTTSAAHNFQNGDSITVALPTTASVTQKAVSGAQAILTTSSAHGFSVDDTVVVSFPASATLSNSRSSAGSAGGYLVTLNTTGSHGFNVGERIAVNVGITSTVSVTNRASSTTTRTLTSASHGFNIGERITVSGINANYDGSYVITAVTSNTFSYVAASFTEASTASGGSVVNQTISTSYNGNKVIETVPSSTSLTYLAYDQDGATSSTTAGTGATLTNTTNVAFNGTKTLLSASGTLLSYNL